MTEAVRRIRLFERDDGGSPTAGFAGSVAVFQYVRSARENAPDDFPLDSDAAPVNDPQSLEPAAPCFFQVLLDDRLDVARRDRMEIEDVGDRNGDRIVGIGVHR